MKKSRLLGAVCAVSFTLSAHAAVYSIIDLGTLGGGAPTHGYGINDIGQVTGISRNIHGNDRAFLYDGNIMQDLGAFNNYVSVGYGINDSGQVTGYSRYSGAGVGAANTAFLYNGTTMQDLGTLGGGGIESWGQDINNSGYVTGYSNYNISNHVHAFLYDGNTMDDLGTLGGTDSLGYGINESGQVAGWSITGSGENHAFLYDGTIMQDLGTLGGAQSLGYSINNSGQVAGYSHFNISGQNHAFLYDGTTMQDLGTLGGIESWGRGINDSGQVVGQSQNAGGQEIAFFHDGGSMLDLCALVDCVSAGWDYLANALAINDSGYITGVGYINGESRAFLVQVSAIPLPAAAWLFGSGLLGLIVMAMKKDGLRPLFLHSTELSRTYQHLVIHTCRA